jgi:two-component system alkaline phosphatase synthesis response regulator PhoP
MAEEKTKILLVEDDIPLRDMYQTRLEMEGYVVFLASDGEEALSKAVDEKPDLILLDIMMPKISGFDTLDILKTTDKTKNIPIVVLTALKEKSDKERGLAYGADDYLIKSECTLENVVTKVQEVLKKRGKE